MAEPTFKATVVVCTHRDIKVSALASLWILRDCPDPKIDIQFQDGDALISRSRSVRATKFMESDSDVLCFIDDDIFINPKDVRKMMWMVYQGGLDIVGAAYATKNKENPGFAIRPLSDGITMRFGKNGGLYEVRDVSTGAICISRKVFKKMISSGYVHYCSHGSRSYYPFFQHREVQEEDGTWEDKSEDWFFNWQARKLGFKVWVDTSIRTEHVGPYAFTMDDVFECRNGLRKKYEDIDFKVVPEKTPDLILKSA